MFNLVMRGLLLTGLVSTQFAYASQASHNVLKLAKDPITAQVQIQDERLAPEERTKTLYFMHFKLTPEQQKYFLSTNPKANSKKIKALAPAGLPTTLDVGMNGVPVLDQGQHGSCVTFSNTAAVNALLGRGDYISQLCNLELGTFLAMHGYWPDGWNGTFGSVVLNQMTQFGIVPKAYEPQLRCGGMTTYPVNTTNTGYGFPIENFIYSSTNAMKNLYWNVFLDGFQRFNQDPLNPYNPNATIAEIKSILYVASLTPRQSARVTIGLLLYEQFGVGGANAKYMAANDTWSVTSSIAAQTSAPNAGHEVIVTGYNDNALVVDPDGTTHQGVFIIRNSWGTTVGNQGTFYMTYDYFAKFANEAQKIMVVPPTNS